MAVRCKVRVCGLLPAGIVGLNPADKCQSLVNVVCCQVDIFGNGRSVIQRSPKDCGMSNRM